MANHHPKWHCSSEMQQWPRGPCSQAILSTLSEEVGCGGGGSGQLAVGLPVPLPQRRGSAGEAVSSAFFSPF